MSTYSFTLYDLSGNLNENEFRDDKNQVAYLIRPTREEPGFQFPVLPTSITVTRQSDWGIALEHEPWRAVLSYGVNDGFGTVKVGDRGEVSMEKMLVREPQSDKRCFTGLDGREYYWKPASRRLECFDKNDGLLAVYEYLLDDPSYAKLDIKPQGWSMTTELITTLILNRHAIRHGL